MNIQIQISGDKDEMMEFYHRWLNKAVKSMNKSLTKKEAREIWEKYPAFHDNMVFFNAKEKAKNRLTK